jgi:N-acetylglucosamine kinase-like BadF-type ATPase
MMYLGVDGGGTKTALCLVDRGGQVAAQTQAPSCYYFKEGIDLVGRVLREGIGEVCEEASVTPADIRYAFFGLPTYGEVSGDVPTLDGIPGEILGHGRYACDNDMVCGWAGSLGGVDGINVVSGTGSITYGERAGRSARVGGWGDLFGDEGSAYWIAIKGLNAFSRMSDGRLPAGALHEALRTNLELAADLDLVDVVLNRWQGGRSEIAALSRIVVGAAETGDECAAQILSEAAEELAGLVDTTRRILHFGLKEKVPVSYSGGVFNVPSVVDGFEAALEGLHEKYELREPLYSPVIGAAIYAAKLAGEPLGAEKLGRHRGRNVRRFRQQKRS